MPVTPTALRERTSGCDPLVLACILARHVTKTNGHLAPWAASVGLCRSRLGAPREHGIPPRGAETSMRQFGGRQFLAAQAGRTFFSCRKRSTEEGTMLKGKAGDCGLMNVRMPPPVAAKLQRLIAATGRSSGGIIRDLIMAAQPEDLPPPPPGTAAGRREPLRPEHLD